MARGEGPPRGWEEHMKMPAGRWVFGPGFPACAAAGFPHTPRMFTTDLDMHPREINTVPRDGVGTSIAVQFSVTTEHKLWPVNGVC